MTFSSLLKGPQPDRSGITRRLEILVRRLIRRGLPTRGLPPGHPGIGELWRPALCTACLLLVAGAQAQQSERFGPYELHYSVVNTTFLQPETAAAYNITRGKKRAILNLAVREHAQAAGADAPGGTQPRAMELDGKTWDLIQNQPLEFREIREGPAIYYIAEFKFIDEEWRFFEIDFKPEGATRAYRFKFKHQVYIN